MDALSSFRAGLKYQFARFTGVQRSPSPPQTMEMTPMTTGQALCP